VRGPACGEITNSLIKEYKYRRINSCKICVQELKKVFHLQKEANNRDTSFIFPHLNFGGRMSLSSKSLLYSYLIAIIYTNKLAYKVSKSKSPMASFSRI
jgi:hypothetical protein